MSDKQGQPDSTEPELPQEVTSELKRMFGPSIEISEAVDQAVLADARSVLSQEVRTVPQRPAQGMGRWAFGLVAAGSLAAVLVLVMLPNEPQSDVVAERGVESPVATPEIVSRRDIDGNGRVDILDAYTLSRMIENSTAGISRDQNNDNILDDNDVNLVAEAAVTL